MDPLTILGIAGTVIGGLFGLGAMIGGSPGSHYLKQQGQNDLTETDCSALCEQIKDRWNELCLSNADVLYLKNKFHECLWMEAMWIGIGIAAQTAGHIALGSLFGAFLAPGFYAAAAAAFATAVVWAGYTSIFLSALMSALKLQGDARRALQEAIMQMGNNCGWEQTTDCQNQIPTCPWQA